MKTKHTPGPWGFNVGKNGKVNGFEAVRIYGKEDMVLDFAHCNPGQNEIDAARVVACVNACEGIEDPSVVPEMLEAFHNIGQLVTDMMNYPDATEENRKKRNQIGSLALVMLARAEGRDK